VTSAAESTTGVKTKSAANRIRRVLMDQVMIDVRGVVGRENNSSQRTSLLMLACGDGQNKVRYGTRTRLASF
jgi:hypothetical protein